MLLAGDLLDGRQTYRETAQALARALGEIPCPVFLAPGNHDYMSPASLYATLEWPENVTVFTGGELAAVELPHLGCVVHGRGFQAPREEKDPLAGFQAPQDGKLHLMVLHGEVEGQGNYAPIAREKHRPQRPCLPGPGPYPPVQRGAAGGKHLLGLPRLPRGPGL